MARFDDQPVWRSATSEGIDEGLRAFMIKVYMYMAMGLALTGIVAYGIASSPDMLRLIFATPLKWVFMLAPLGVVLFLSARISHIKFATAQMLFWVYAALMGISLSAIFMVFTGESITRLFFVSASVFGTMSIYGYTTKRDLTAFGSFLFMGVIGIVIASVVNIFTQSSMMQMVISSIAVLVFTGLTAYDTQAIKSVYYDADDMEVAGKKAVFGALQLYLDFINIFISLLQLFGDRR
jgi:FtsH-binding integral membrane protein